MTLRCVTIAAREREVCLDIVKVLSVIVLLSMSLYYLPINGTTFELYVFWQSDTERRIKLMFYESVPVSLKTRLMALLNMLQETSGVPA